MSITIREVPLAAIWQIRQEVMYPELTIASVKLKDDPEGIHLGLFDEATLCSVISIFKRGADLQFRKFATLTPFQGQGYGKKLLQYVFEWAHTQGVQTIWCNARTSATGLYRKFGMEPFGESWQENGHQFVKMKTGI